MACNEETATFIVDTPLGDFELVICRNGLHSSKLMVLNDDDFFPDLTKHVIWKSEKFSASLDDERIKYHLISTLTWFKIYFSCPLMLDSYSLPTLCLDSIKGRLLRGTWVTLAYSVHAGQTITYADLAARVGHEGAARAVGQAMAGNTFQLVVPCHRVVLKSGKIGNYCRGTKNKVKAWLLDFEKTKAPRGRYNFWKGN